MIEKGTGFARYSKSLCWIVALISLLVAILTFTGSAENSGLLGFLWLAVAVAFSLSAMFLGGGSAPQSASEDSQDSSSD